MRAFYLTLRGCHRTCTSVTSEVHTSKPLPIIEDTNLVERKTYHSSQEKLRTEEYFRSGCYVVN